MRNEGYSTAAPFIAPRVLEGGGVRFDKVPTVANVEGYVKCGDEHYQLVYVPRDYVELYRTYTAYRRGEHHFYDRSLKDRLRSLEFRAKYSSNDPTKQYAQATHHYERAAECFAKAVELEKQQKKWAVEIEEVREEMDRQEREGYARLFGGDDDE